MKSLMFLPRKIVVGYQFRDDTYTNKLAYVIYRDEKNTLRKEKSWNQWRDENISIDEFDNIPIAGFVLNKNVGGYCDHWMRSSYIRIYDPRGFEFEITLPNLLYILEHSSSTNKKLKGEFVYGWNNSELFLIPVSAPDYPDFKKYTDNIFKPEKIKPEQLIVGAKYLLKDNTEVIYLGKHEIIVKNYYNTFRYDGLNYCYSRAIENSKYNPEQDYIQCCKSFSDKILCISEEKPHKNTAEMLNNIYNKFNIDFTGVAYYKPTKKELKEYLKKNIDNEVDVTLYKGNFINNSVFTAVMNKNEYINSKKCQYNYYSHYIVASCWEDYSYSPKKFGDFWNQVIAFKKIENGKVVDHLWTCNLVVEK